MNARLSRKIVGFLASAAIVTTAAAVAAPAAQAYPAGNALTLSASKYNVSKPGAEIRVQATHVYPRCSVSVAFQTKNGDKVTLVAGANGATSMASISTPKRAGVYELVAKTLKPCASPTGLESDSVNIYVGHETHSRARLSSSATVVGAKTVFTVSGNISEGTDGVEGLPVEIRIQRPNGSFTSTVLTRTGNDGQFSIRIAGEATQKGAYQAFIAFAGDSDLIGSSDSSNDLTLNK